MKELCAPSFEPFELWGANGSFCRANLEAKRANGKSQLHMDLDGNDAAVTPSEDFADNIYDPPSRPVPPREAPDVFFIHRGPDSKGHIIRPLVHVLENEYRVKCFADFHYTDYSMVSGVENVQNFQRGLWSCAMAVMVHSGLFEESEYAIKEYRTMMRRELLLRNDNMAMPLLLLDGAI